jgi:hypothetical protein
MLLEHTPVGEGLGGGPTGRPWRPSAAIAITISDVWPPSPGLRHPARGTAARPFSSVGTAGPSRATRRTGTHAPGLDRVFALRANARAGDQLAVSVDDRDVDRARRRHGRGLVRRERHEHRCEERAVAVAQLRVGDRRQRGHRDRGTVAQVAAARSARCLPAARTACATRRVAPTPPGPASRTSRVLPSMVSASAAARPHASPYTGRATNAVPFVFGADCDGAVAHTAQRVDLEATARVRSSSRARRPGRWPARSGSSSTTVTVAPTTAPPAASRTTPSNGARPLRDRERREHDERRSAWPAPAGGVRV